MSRSYEAFGQFDLDPWYEYGMRDAEWQDAMDTEPPTEPRFFTPPSFVPVIPPPEKSSEYNAFTGMSDEEVEQFKIREK